MFFFRIFLLLFCFRWKWSAGAHLKLGYHSSDYMNLPVYTMHSFSICSCSCLLFDYRVCKFICSILTFHFAFFRLSMVDASLKFFASKRWYLHNVEKWRKSHNIWHLFAAWVCATKSLPFFCEWIYLKIAPLNSQMQLNFFDHFYLEIRINH